jgi:hypothetical protein
MTRTPNPRVRQAWQARIDDQPTSGLSIAQFCNQQGCSVASFYHWKRKLAQSPVTAHESELGLPANVHSFFELTTRPLLPADQVVELDLPGGTVARIPLDPRLALELILRHSAPIAKG